MTTKPYKESVAVEVRKVKETLAAKFNFDVRAMLADAREREERHGKRLVSFVKRKLPAKH